MVAEIYNKFTATKNIDKMLFDILLLPLNKKKQILYDSLNLKIYLN